MPPSSPQPPILRTAFNSLETAMWKEVCYLAAREGEPDYL